MKYRGIKAEQMVLVIVIFSLITIGFSPPGLAGSYGDKARFSSSYIKENRGRIQIEIPPAVELAYIIIAVADYGKDEAYRQGLVNKASEYYQKVLERFLPFKDHPVMDELEFRTEDSPGYYLNVVRACYLYEYTLNWLRRPVFRHRGMYDQRFDPHFARLIQDFGAKSEFLDFYQENQGFYSEQIQLYAKRVQVKKAWEWLEDNFPVQHDSYRIIFSPLNGGTNSTKTFTDYQDGRFSETVMFMSSPQQLDLFIGFHQQQAIADALMTSSVFTEIDHNYVNPVSNNYLSEIDAALTDLTFWNSIKRITAAPTPPLTSI